MGLPEQWPPPGIDWYYSDDWACIAHADCREILPKLPKVDLVLTDPPYGIGLDTSNTKYRGGIARKLVVGDNEPFDPKDILTLDAKMIIWGGNCFASQLTDHPGWLCWVKTVRNGASIRQADMELAWTNFIRRSQCFRYLWIGAYRDGESGQRSVHPTQKPIEVMKWCIRLSCGAMMVLDPFMGSGTTLRAAKDLGRKSIGIEIEERYCEIAARRLSQEVIDFAAAHPRRTGEGMGAEDGLS